MSPNLVDLIAFAGLDFEPKVAAEFANFVPSPIARMHVAAPFCQRTMSM